MYGGLAADPKAVIVEVPFPMPSQWFLNGPYMVNATRHWRPMLNGYSGFRPPWVEKSSEAMSTFPSDRSLIMLHGLGVTHVLIHEQAYSEGVGHRVKDLA